MSDAAADMAEQCAQLLQKMQRDINCLADSNKFTRKKSLQNLQLVRSRPLCCMC
jgi:hypothetical protein